MAEIGGGGTPANDAERLVIAHLRDHAPDDWFVLHNIEIPVRGDAYEVDLVVVTGHAVCVIDVKGTRGRTDVSGFRWYPENRGSFASPVRKLRGHARALKGLLERSRPELSQVYVDQLVVLPAPDAVLVDPSDRPDADARDVTDLPGLIPALADVSRVRVGMSRDIRAVTGVVREALSGGVRRPGGPKHFGEWLVAERLGGDDDVTEYRARNGNVPTAETVLLRVYRADPFLPAAQREAQQHAIANAYEVLAKMPASPYVVGRRTFFPVEDESQFVLVLDDVRGQALAVHVADPRRALGADAKLRVIGDMVRGLAHAHASSVLHRALSPATVLVVAGSGQALLTGFDFGRPEQPRPHTVLPRLAEEVDPAYVAPECQGRPQAMSRASDVYAAGVIAFRLLTGELPFADSADQFRSGSELPAAPMAAAGLGADLVGLLRRMCARSPSARPTAGDAVRDLARIVGAGRTPTTTGSASGVARVDYRNLPSGYQLSRKFTVRRKLGTGSFGTAYQAYDTMSGTDRVVKVVHTDRQSVLDRVRGEYQILSRLPPHRSVVKVEDANFLDGGIPYLEFEYVDGREVSELVEERALGPADTVQLGIDIADGLTYLHENGVYHCDIKPKNLLRTDAGGKIFDFNVAVTSDSSLSGAGGTGRYVPPDLGGGATTGADLIDRDVYALGVTLYEVLTGAAPFTGHAAALGERPADPRGRSGLIQLSDELVAVLLRAVAPFRSERYRSAREFREALREVADRTQRPAAPEPAGPGALSEPGVGINPFVAHLRTLYSQSTSTNAGTRSGPASPYDLYVRTALDDQLTPDVRRGDHRLVIITGNAGDGKTAYLERLLTEAWADGPRRPIRRDNGADFQLPDGRWLRVTYDGSQDEGEKSNDEVLLDFFASFAGADPAGIPDETRLIAINEGRLVDFFDVHADRFPALAARVHAGLTGSVVEQGIAVINLNRRSLLHTDDEDFPPVFDRMLSTLTDPRRWTACEGCELIASCYARHNARTFAHAGAGPKISARLRHLFRLTELRGAQHLTVRDIRSALAFVLTSGRNCNQIHDLYVAGTASEVLAGFYFNSWTAPGTADRLLNAMSRVDMAAAADPELDRRLDYVGPDGGRALMTVDQRGDYDARLLATMAAELPRGAAVDGAVVTAHREYLSAARRRFYFECIDDERARQMLPYRSAQDFADLLDRPESIASRLPDVISALNRGEGIEQTAALDGALALQVREVPSATIRSYRLFPSADLELAVAGRPDSPYLDGAGQELLLRHRGAGGHQARLRIRLDLFELLWRLRDGYLPGIAEQQGQHLGLTIFKNELLAAPYRELLLTVTGRELWRVSREAGGTVRMRPLAVTTGAEVPDGAA